eukprot:1561950-Pleurochrysis_carterae.AAC.1
MPLMVYETGRRKARGSAHVKVTSKPAHEPAGITCQPRSRADAVSRLRRALVSRALAPCGRRVERKSAGTDATAHVNANDAGRATMLFIICSPNTTLLDFCPKAVGTWQS